MQPGAGLEAAPCYGSRLEMGQVMSGESYRGIFYSVVPIGERKWKWEIEPPWSVKGLRRESGEVEGHAPDAAAAARSAIDSQTKQYTG